MVDFSQMKREDFKRAAVAKAKAAGLQTSLVNQKGDIATWTAYLEHDTWAAAWDEKKAHNSIRKAPAIVTEPVKEPLLVNDILPAPRPDAETTTETAAISNEDMLTAANAAVGDETRECLFISAADMMLQTVVIKKLIGKVIERGTTGQLFGPSGGGKTFIALEMALAVGTGGEWNGNQCEQGLVLYFNGEGFPGMHRRVKAWHKQQGEPDLSSVHISRTVITFDGAGMGNVITRGRELEAKTGKQVALIVIDTLARHLIGDENSTKGMSDFVREVDSLRDAFPDSSAIIIHHSGNDAEKMGRSRGSSALKAACDFEMQCLKGTLTFTKMKDGAIPEPVGFELVPVQIGTDDDGEPITSCIVQYREQPAKNSKEALSQYELLLLELVNNNPDILSKDLRAAFYEKRREHESDVILDTLKKSYDRSLTGLTGKGKVFKDGDVVKAGQGTLSGHSGTLSRQVEGQTGTSSLRDVPMSLLESMSNNHLYIEDAVYTDFSPGQTLSL